MKRPKDRPVEDDPLWYKDAIIYQLHVKSFFDSTNDGIGDFRGLMEKLDYFERLGVTALWILPFYPSPLKDDGYDIAYYFDVNPHYGDLKDFREFLKAAQKRGLKIITELVLNHTSDQHPWFQRSRRSHPGSVWRDYYVWSDSPEKYKDTRIIFKDFETSNWTWDPVAKAYFWHRFYSHQPDLNYDNPHVQKSMLKVLDNWLSTGVDGLRLDAVPYLFERENTNCENLPETHAFLKNIRSYVDEKFKSRMLLGEANQWPEDAAAYFGIGDECHMAFHFPVMPRIFMALRMEDRFPIIDILDQTPEIPETSQWAMFLRNHDELTLEMVTDEERDYMYRVYAQDPKTRINLGIRRRLAPLVGNNRRIIELMNIILFSLPGTPIIYYGDEIGMGDNYYLGDRDGVRTPMQWSSDRNAGFSKANPHKLFLPVIIDPEYHYEAVNVENQERNPSSLLWWTKRVIAMRKRFKAFGRGTLEVIPSDNPKVLSFVRKYNGETLLVVINLSRFSQVAELDLKGYGGHTPVEVFSRNRFPAIKDDPYVITLGFYDYFWFSLEKAEAEILVHAEKPLPELAVRKKWDAVFEGRSRTRLEEEILPAYFRGVRWFGGKARTIRRLKIIEELPVEYEGWSARLIFVDVHYTDGSAGWYLLPLAAVTGERIAPMLEENRKGVIAMLKVDDDEALLIDAVYDEQMRNYLLLAVSQRKKIRGRMGNITAMPGRKFRSLLGGRSLPLASSVIRAEQTNTSLLYDNVFFLKLYRRLNAGMNPDLEISRALTEKAGFTHIPPYAGVLEYHRDGAETIVIGQVQGFIPNEGDAWTYSLDVIGRYFERVLTEAPDIVAFPCKLSALFDMRYDDISPLIQELVGADYFERVRLLGQRSAELHNALASITYDPDFEPEPFSMLYQRSLYQSMRNLTRRTFHLLEKNVKRLPDDIRDDAALILGSEEKILSQFRKILSRKMAAMKLRFHGDYHLGQVLNTGKDFTIIDFEGEPARALSERRLKRSPLRDVAGMIRSFQYAAYNSLLRKDTLRAEDIPRLETWADIWYHSVSGIFLGAYLAAVPEDSFIPKDRDDLENLLTAFLLEKAVYEIGYELDNRPEWVIIPLRGLKHILHGSV